MKRVTEDFNVYLPPVRLYLDDVQQLLDQLTGFKEITLRHRNFEYSSLDELKDHVSRKTISNFSLTAHGKKEHWAYLSIDVSVAQVVIHADKEAYSEAAMISEYLRTKVPWYSWYPVNRPWWYALEGALCFALISAAYPVASFIAQGNILTWILIDAVIISLAVYLLWPQSVRLGGSTIRLYPAASETGFWERNRENILVSIVKYIGAGVVGYFFGRMSH